MKRCNPTNGVILLGHFYDCIFSLLLVTYSLYNQRAVRQTSKWQSARASFYTWCYFQSSIFPSVSFIRLELKGTADGGITTDTVLILNTLKRRSCILLNAPEDSKRKWFHLVASLNPVGPWGDYLCPTGKWWVLPDDNTCSNELVVQVQSKHWCGNDLDILTLFTFLQGEI